MRIAILFLLLVACSSTSPASSPAVDAGALCCNAFPHDTRCACAGVDDAGVSCSVDRVGTAGACSFTCSQGSVSVTENGGLVAECVP